MNSNQKNTREKKRYNEKNKENSKNKKIKVKNNHK